MAETTEAEYTEIRTKVSDILRDLHTEVCDKIGRAVPTEHWGEVTGILISLDEMDLAEVWKEGLD